MKKIIFNLLILILTGISAFAKDKPTANDLVRFLAGEWQNVSFEIADGKPVKREEYPETMIIKDKDTLTITAHGFKNGKDLTKDMRIELRGNKLTLSQDSFIATGTKEDGVYNIKGNFAGAEYRLRLYTMGDKYVFHRETWKNGTIQQVDMSYLTRKETP